MVESTLHESRYLLKSRMRRILKEVRAVTVIQLRRNVDVIPRLTSIFNYDIGMPALIKSGAKPLVLSATSAILPYYAMKASRHASTQRNHT
jgi:hypothetical protein